QRRMRPGRCSGSKGAKMPLLEMLQAITDQPPKLAFHGRYPGSHGYPSVDAPLNLGIAAAIS
ncbi:hypothetical protein ACWTU6_31420, partial [Mesorhizobium sp. BHbsci]